MALITVSDITTYMDITFTNVQEDAAQFVIDGLQAELEAVPAQTGGADFFY